MRRLLLLLLIAPGLLSCQRLGGKSVSRLTVAPVGTALPGTPEPSSSPSPTGTSNTIAQGYRYLLERLVLPVKPSDLLQAAWLGATADARRQGATSTPNAPNLSGDADADLAAFQAAFAALLGSGSSPPNEGRLARAALMSMAEAVNDCHTAYLSAGEWASIEDDLAGKQSIAGLPLSFQLQAPFLIESVVPGSNADTQGVRPGDKITSFDGAPLDQLPLSQRKFLNAGSPGSTARLELQSVDGSRPSVTVRRESVDRPLVVSKLIGDVGYVRLRTFSTNLSPMIDPTIDSLQGEGARGFVLDLRGNLGGELDSDVHLLSLFIPSGLLTTSTGRNGRSEDIEATGAALPGPPPLAVLVDGGSLSASELFAEAIKQFGAGEIVGTRTPGCLLGSNFRSMDDASSMQITVDTVTVGPQRTVVNNVGVEPDVTVSIEAADLAAGRDPQLDRAVTDVERRLGTTAAAGPSNAKLSR
jgi:carboxyl-terminal processing protease